MKIELENLINKNLTDADSLIVLKGFPLKLLDREIKSLKSIIENKKKFIGTIIHENRPIISYDEFVCFFDSLKDIFEKIYIIENGEYLNIYPIDINIPDNIIQSLLIHFDEEADENTQIDDISEYINVYSNFMQNENGFCCCFNMLDNSLKSTKIEIISIGESSKEISEIKRLESDMIYLSLCTDIDYYSLVYRLINTNNRFAVTWENYSSERYIILKKLNILSTRYPNRLYSYLKQSEGDKDAPKTEIYSYLERYWGYTEFRTLKIYDINELENKNKVIKEVSQSDIINDLITQTENCINAEWYRDTFITAPTGSGKSLMFQIPAMYLADKYGLLTIVITPLIGLMNDQVEALKKKGYNKVETINSDISPITKEAILSNVANGLCDILYLSPESLLSKSDIAQLIGTRKIGMFVIDEAHIVTTWGKQFRPDYWYLGDYVQKLRKAQASKTDNPSSFIVATFTATAIYEGLEDMYHETLNSLHMIDPITYLGYVRRENISIDITQVELKKAKIEYQINKFDDLIEIITPSIARNQKTLIYFPTVSLILQFNDYCYSKGLERYVTKYHGKLYPDEKNDNFQAFKDGIKKVMIATKAFGMGIDIPDITNVVHFAPTGNVCDYMQEIGRAARDINIDGHAIYRFMSNDFQHINRLYGLSAIRKYQLVEVIKKILELYTSTRFLKGIKTNTKKRNEMLIDTDCFSYIFEVNQTDESDMINKVKTAMLLIQKDYETKKGFSPFYMRPIPLFAYGYFAILPNEQIKLNSEYIDSLELVYYKKNICKVNLKKIWEKSFDKIMSFPKFKYLLYSKSPELNINDNYNFKPAVSVEITMSENPISNYEKIVKILKNIITSSIYNRSFISKQEMVDTIQKECKFHHYKAESIINVFMSSLDIFQQQYSNKLNSKLYSTKALKNGNLLFSFSSSINQFYNWLNKGYKYIENNLEKNLLYLVDEPTNFYIKEFNTILGILESMNVLHFKSLGGSNSQIYIYVNETKNMQMVKDKPGAYRNKLLDKINKRHEDSVKMLTYLFESKKRSEEIWNDLENYFIGIAPEALHIDPVINPADMEDLPILLEVGLSTREYYTNWSEVCVVLENNLFKEFEQSNVPLPDYLDGKLIVDSKEIIATLVWNESKLAITSGEEPSCLRDIAKESDWTCIPIKEVSVNIILENLR